MATKIIVTGANGQVGKGVLSRLWDTNAETYAVSRGPASLQASRVFTSSLNGEKVQKAIHQSDVAIHLAGTLWPKASNSYYGANVCTTTALIRAAKDSNVKRIIFLSSIDASVDSTNEYLRTKARAEQLILSTGIPAVIFRCSHIIGKPSAPGPTAAAMLSAEGEPVKVLGSGQQIVAPVYVDDVAAAIIQAIEKGRSGIYELSGPDRMTMDELVRMVNQNVSVPIRHLPARLAKLLSKVLPGLPPALIDIMLKPSVGNPARAIAEFGIGLTSLPGVWRTCPDAALKISEKSSAVEFLT